MLNQLQRGRWTILGAAGLGAIVLLIVLFGQSAQGEPQHKPAALAGHEVVFAQSGDPSITAVQNVTAQCPPGKGVIAGGYSFSNTGVVEFVIIDNHPVSEFTTNPGGIVTHDGWHVTVKRTANPTNANWAVLAWAACVSTEAKQ